MENDYAIQFYAGSVVHPMIWSVDIEVEADQSADNSRTSWLCGHSQWRSRDVQQIAEKELK